MLEQLGQIVVDLGTDLRAWRRTGAVQGAWDGPQFKAHADLRAHDALRCRLADLAADIPVVSEEDTASQAAHRPDRCFLIDPIDGTASYAGGYPGYVTQIALMVASRPVAAAIYAPELDLLYLAEHGAGATRNGLRLQTSADAARTVLIDNEPEPRGTARQAFEALPCTGYVESGSISLKICRVADGTADLFFKDVMVRDWDFAAPHLVLAEAGGVLTMLDGSGVEYKGPYERPGLVAARSERVRRQLTDWFNRRAA